MSLYLEDKGSKYNKLGQVFYGGRYEPILVFILLITSFSFPSLQWYFVFLAIGVEIYCILNIHNTNITLNHIIDDIKNLENYKENEWLIDLKHQRKFNKLAISAVPDRLNWSNRGNLDEKAYYLKVYKKNLSSEKELLDFFSSNKINIHEEGNHYNFGQMSKSLDKGDQEKYINLEILIQSLKILYPNGNDYFHYRTSLIMDKELSRSIFDQAREASVL